MSDKFLAHELKGLPETLQHTLLKQLEGVIKEIDRAYRPFQALTEIQSTVLCAKIYAVLDMARKFRKDLESQDSEDWPYMCCNVCWLSQISVL